MLQEDRDLCLEGEVERGRERGKGLEREIRQVMTFAVKNYILTQGNNYKCAVDVE